MQLGYINSIVTPGKFPILNLSQQLEIAKHHIARNTWGYAVCREYLDPYLHSAIAQDRWLVRIAEGLLETQSWSWVAPTQAQRLQEMLCSETRGVGLSSSRALSAKKILGSFSRSTAEGLINFISVAWKTIRSNTKIEFYSLPSEFERLWGLSFW